MLGADLHRDRVLSVLRPTPTWSQDTIKMDTPCPQGEPKTYLDPIKIQSRPIQDRIKTEHEHNRNQTSVLKVPKNSRKMLRTQIHIGYMGHLEGGIKGELQGVIGI